MHERTRNFLFDSLLLSFHFFTTSILLNTTYPSVHFLLFFPSSFQGIKEQQHLNNVLRNFSNRFSLRRNCLFSFSCRLSFLVPETAWDRKPPSSLLTDCESRLLFVSTHTRLCYLRKRQSLSLVWYRHISCECKTESNVFSTGLTLSFFLGVDQLLSETALQFDSLSLCWKRRRISFIVSLNHNLSFSFCTHIHTPIGLVFSQGIQALRVSICMQSSSKKRSDKEDGNEEERRMNQNIVKSY